jgi:hypothetical protein
MSMRRSAEAGILATPVPTQVLRGADGPRSRVGRIGIRRSAEATTTLNRMVGYLGGSPSQQPRHPLAAAVANRPA